MRGLRSKGVRAPKPRAAGGLGRGRVRGERNRAEGGAGLRHAVPSSGDLSASVVMAGLDPAIHDFKAWMPGTRPGMTEGNGVRDAGNKKPGRFFNRRAQL